MKTGTHYVDAGGQHYLPECMQNICIMANTTIVDGDTYAAMGADEADAIRDACRALGIETEADDEGALCATAVREDDLLGEFAADDRYCVLSPSDIECHGGTAVAAAAWLLDTENSESFCAVLDPDDMMVASRNDDGDVVGWQPLEAFMPAAV